MNKFKLCALCCCDPDCFDEEGDQYYKDFDICKSYPNVLLRNNQPIPIYSIHDSIEEFNSIHNLDQTSEFYIDEVILDKHRCGP